jgi:hypothetical protein
MNKQEAVAAVMAIIRPQWSGVVERFEYGQDGQLIIHFNGRRLLNRAALIKEVCGDMDAECNIDQLDEIHCRGW